MRDAVEARASHVEGRASGLAPRAEISGADGPQDGNSMTNQAFWPLLRPVEARAGHVEAPRLRAAHAKTYGTQGQISPANCDEAGPTLGADGPQDANHMNNHTVQSLLRPVEA